MDQEQLKEEEEFGWRYAILKKRWGGQYYYHVCEEFCGVGYSGEETPLGDTPEELLECLEMMAADVRAAIQHENIIEDGQPYDAWLLRERMGGETVEWGGGFTEEELEELIADDIGDLDTIPNGKALENDENDSEES